MVSVRRNQMLEDLCRVDQERPEQQGLHPGRKADDCKPEVRQGLERILDQFGDLAWEKGRLGQDRGRLLNLVLQMASRSENGNIPKAGDPRGIGRRRSCLVLRKSKSLMPLNSSIWPGPAIGSGMMTTSTWERSRARCWPPWRKASRRIQGRPVLDSKTVKPMIC